MAGFELSKWYLDCVTDSGDVSIAYSGTVCWGAIALHYASLLENSGSLVQTRRTLRPQARPRMAKGVLRWNSRALHVSGEWPLDVSELRETVFSSDSGSVEWHCLAPRTRAAIGTRAGLGYAEFLRMTIEPWKLPLRTLRWGRFLTPSDWIVWIDWLGEAERRIVYRNGEATPVDFIGDDRIEFSDGSRLVMDRSLVLREGALGATAFARLARIRRSFPGRLLEIAECKWRSRGSYQRRGAEPADGWVIHEKVDWPQ